MRAPATYLEPADGAQVLNPLTGASMFREVRAFHLVSSSRLLPILLLYVAVLVPRTRVVER